MPRFFAEFGGGDSAVITGQNAIHIRRSLRMRPGNNLTLCDGQGNDYYCEITSFEGEDVMLKVLYRTPTTCEPTTRVTLYQGLPKGDKLEWIIQKAVELGVYAVVPVETARSISRIDEASDRSANKQKRLQKIADEAAGQSGRGILPKVETPLNFKQALERIRNEGSPVIVFYEGGGSSLGGMIDPSCKNISIVIGPEGGFEPSEIEALKDIGAQTGTLGPRILRCETAPIAALAVIMSLTGNMG